MENLIKFKKELLNELKKLADGEYLYFSYPTNDTGIIIPNEHQLELFIDIHKDEYWFANAIGYKVDGNKLELIWDAKTKSRIDADKQEFYRRKADFIGKYGSN